MGDIRELAESLLSRSAGIDLDVLAETVLFTCPAGKSCIITKIVARGASAAIGTASISFGWNSGNADNVVANGALVLSGATNYEIIPAKSDAVRGAAGGTFKLDVNTQEGAADTVIFDVFGYLY